MKKLLMVLLIFSLLMLSSCSFPFIFAKKSFKLDDTLGSVTDKTCRVVLLYGQSNATGCSRNSELEKNDKDRFDEYSSGYDNVYINYCTENGANESNGFVKCTLGCGASKDCFGPEMGIAEVLSSEYKDEDVYIIKYTWGGSALYDNWFNKHGKRGALYKAAINFTIKSLDYLISKGYSLDILGICWMQGESDSSEKLSKLYEENTKNLIGYFREDLSNYSSNIRFVDAYIEDIDEWVCYKEVNKAKLNVAKTLENVVVIDTYCLTTANEPEGNVDRAHYDSLSMVQLGTMFGAVLIR